MKFKFYKSWYRLNEYFLFHKHEFVKYNSCFEWQKFGSHLFIKYHRSCSVISKSNGENVAAAYFMLLLATNSRDHQHLFVVNLLVLIGIYSYLCRCIGSQLSQRNFLYMVIVSDGSSSVTNRLANRLDVSGPYVFESLKQVCCFDTNTLEKRGTRKSRIIFTALKSFGLQCAWTHREKNIQILSCSFACPWSHGQYKWK